MQILGTGYNIPWLPQPNEISLILDDSLPPQALMTSAFALVFCEGNFLMTKLHHRGWDIPGGHIDPGETPEQTVRRELMEEAAVELGAIRLFGYQKIRLLGEVPNGYRYPYSTSYQVFYLGYVTKILPFTPTTEAEDRAFLPQDAALTQRWVQENRLLFDAAQQAIATRERESNL